VQNRATHPIIFEEALHTYFAISDISTIAISGLAMQHARNTAMKGLARSRELADRHRNDREGQHQVAIMLNKLGSIAHSSGEDTEALKAGNLLLSLGNRSFSTWPIGHPD
jgi:hypothetical protein